MLSAFSRIGDDGADPSARYNVVESVITVSWRPFVFSDDGYDHRAYVLCVLEALHVGYDEDRRDNLNLDRPQPCSSPDRRRTSGFREAESIGVSSVMRQNVQSSGTANASAAMRL